MRLNDVLQRLKGVKGNGGQYTALCPAHEDKTPSIAISEKEGKILLHCHAGCTKESIVAAIGLEMKDLFVEERFTPSNAPHNTRPNGTNNTKPQKEIAAIYDYKDQHGNLLYQSVRFEPKDFRQRRPDPDNSGKFIWNLKYVETVLYNLPSVAQAIADKQPIIIVEGEKDCDNLAKLDFTATTCPMGAGKWHIRYSEMLKGATVYIISDNDDVGYRHTHVVAQSLSGKAETISQGLWI